jgi:hypothetical protein
LLKLSLFLATIRLEKCFVLKKAAHQAYFPKEKFSRLPWIRNVKYVSVLHDLGEQT